MGVYGATPYVGIRVKDFHLPVNFCAVLMGDPAAGKYVIRAEIRNARGTRIDAEVMPQDFEFTFKPDTGGSILAFRFKATFTAPGAYSLVLINDSNEFFSDTFNLYSGQPSDFS